jgi:hypothetical protein
MQYERFAFLPINRVHGTYFHAFTAVCAFVIVNTGQVILHVDGTGWARFHAATAGNAAYFTLLTYKPPGQQGTTADVYTLFLIHKGDDITGTGFYTFVAACAVFLDYNGQTVVAHVHGIKLAGRNASTVAQAAVGAELVATLSGVGDVTIAGPIIGTALFGFGKTALTQDLGYFPFWPFRFNANNLGNQLGHSRTTNGTTVGRRFSGSHSLSKTATTSKAAGTTVNAGQYFLYLFDLRIGFYCEFLGGYSETKGKQPR